MPSSLTLTRPLLAFAAALMLAILPACGALSQSTSLGKGSGPSGTGLAGAFSGIDFENTTIANFDRCPHMDESETLTVKNGNGTVDVEIYHRYDVDEETYDVFVPGNTKEPLFVKLGARRKRSRSSVTNALSRPPKQPTNRGILRSASSMVPSRSSARSRLQTTGGVSARRTATPRDSSDLRS